MSFSGKIKEELTAHYSKGRHCQLAELAALGSLCGEMKEGPDGTYLLRINSENLSIIRKCFTLMTKTFNIGNEISMQVTVRRNPKKGSCYYLLYAKGRVLRAVDHASVQAVCCKRAYIRGAFLAAGSMSDPGKSYHFEIVCGNMDKALLIQELIGSFGMDAKIVKRKKYYIVYLKEGEQIVDILNVMEAHVALLELENVRILKEMRNFVNRKVNCETANINKTVSAAVRQMEDIKYIRDTIGFEQLPEGLKDVALTRLTYPDATLKELGSLLLEPLGKSGVNHRLRRLSEMAEKLRDN